MRLQPGTARERGLATPVAQGHGVEHHTILHSVQSDVSCQEARGVGIRFKCHYPAARPNARGQ
jgi:hypothetical protein